MASQSTTASRVSTRTRASSSSKRSRYTGSTSGSKALKKAKYAKSQMIAFPKKQPFPSQLVTTLRYSQEVTVSTGLTGQGWGTMCCNGLYDPDVGGIGHQPMYFDQLMAVYNHYCVLKSNITTQYAYSPVSATSPFRYSLFIDDDATPSVGTGTDAMERTGSVTKWVNIAYDGTLASKLKKYWSSGFTFPGDALSRDELQGNSTSNPAEVSNFIIFVDGAASYASTSITFLVHMEFTVVFDEWKSVGGS